LGRTNAAGELTARRSTLSPAPLNRHREERLRRSNPDFACGFWIAASLRSSQ
jgi:hypothetical protein